MGGHSEAATMIQVRNHKALTRVVTAGLRSQKQNRATVGAEPLHLVRQLNRGQERSPGCLRGFGYGWLTWRGWGSGGATKRKGR